MAKEAGESVSQLQPTQQRRHSGIDKAKLIKGYGPYQYRIPAQDQIIAYFENMKIIGTFKKRGDSQSDDISQDLPINEEALEFFFAQLLQKGFEEKIKLTWESEYSSYVEEAIEYVVDTKQADERETDTTTDDISHWPSGQLASEILHPESEADMLRLREMILIAEDTSFTVDQSKLLAQWLLDFAKQHRDSNDPQDEAAVWSAIRTGASMLTPDDTDGLRPLLESGHSIETSLVTVKMVGRIFEAQPPAELDEHQELAGEVYQIAESLLNSYVITSSQSAAFAHLAIYALAAMSSSRTEPIVEAVKKLGVTWFTHRTLRKLRVLSNTWASRPTAIPEAPRQLLEKVLQTLE